MLLISPVVLQIITFCFDYNSLHDILCFKMCIASGDETKCGDLTPPGYTTTFFPLQQCTEGGIVFVVCDRLLVHVTFTNRFPFNQTWFELAQLSLRSDQSHVNMSLSVPAATNQKESTHGRIFHRGIS